MHASLWVFLPWIYNVVYNLHIYTSEKTSWIKILFFPITLCMYFLAKDQCPLCMANSDNQLYYITRLQVKLWTSLMAPATLVHISILSVIVMLWLCAWIACAVFSAIAQCHGWVFESMERAQKSRAALMLYRGIISSGLVHSQFHGSSKTFLQDRSR